MKKLMVDPRRDKSRKLDCNNCLEGCYSLGNYYWCKQTNNSITSYVKRNRRAKSCPAVEVEAPNEESP